MGKHFGNLQRLYGVNYYVLSPTELNPFVGMINPGLRNAARILWKISVTPVIMGSIFLFGCLEAKKYNEKINRKNPEDYKDDV